ncbi:14447_t:CDS:1 [Dentiscutata erythropus]|uniref:14447_t:CDS:1 n=1 Tax=Dentiscutata erythropus TaxID=1348616 RepID=A0A9N9HII2_9GLOM|nr:14447_t:CDS:1 [Dentiscutata erythropus]
MYINTLPIRIRNGHKFPIPLENESYYHRHQPVEFSIKLKNPSLMHSAPGMIFLTDQRFIFIAYEPSSDGFESFYILLSDISSSVTSKSIFNNFFNHNTLSLDVTLKDKKSFTMSITYDYEDIEQKGIFMDYYGMMLSWATNNKSGKLIGRPLSINTLNNFMSDEDRPDSAYFSSWSTNPALHGGEKPPAYS